MKTLNRNFFTTSLVVLACLVLFSVFPTSNIFQEIISSLTFFFVVPILYVKIILKKDLGEFGFQKGDVKKGIILALESLILSILIIYILFEYFSFAKNYQIPPAVANNFQFFVLYEIFIVGFFTALYEILFRGFIQFSFFEKIGFWVILVQFLLFVMLFLATGNLNWSIAPFIVMAPFSGYTALKSKSILYSFVSTLVFIILIDAFVIKMAKWLLLL